MTVNYTSLLALGQPVTGTESGTWGDDVNNAVTSYLDIAIAGTLTLTGDGAVTLANTQGTNTATNIGSTTAQYYILKIVGALSTTKVITAPSTSKTYLVNNTDSTYGVTIKASGQTGVTIPANSRAIVVFNGTDYVLAASSSVSNLSGLGTGVATALGTNVGTAGAFVVNGGALGTPSSGTVTNLTGTASININGTVGATTPTTGAFTTLSATGNTTLGDASGDTLTINGTAVSVPNSLNFDSNTLYIDATNDRVGLSTTTPSYILSAGGNSARTFGMERHTTSNTAGNNLTVLAGGATSGATDKNGGTLALSSGTATGTGSSIITLSTAAADTAGTTDRSPAERVRIDGSGNVGIGTSSTGMNSAGLPLVVGSGSGNTGMTIFSGNASAGSIHFADTATTGADSYRGGISYEHSGNYMRFYTDATDRMRIDSSGNVGIGTSSTGMNSAGLPLVVGSGSGNTGMTIFSGNASAGSIHFADTATTDADSYRGVINYDHSGNFMRLYTDAIERMRIDSSGAVLIGTTTAFAADVRFQVQPISAGSSAFAIGGYDTGSGGSNANTYIELADFNNDGFGDFAYIGYSRGTKASPSAVQSGDFCLMLTFQPRSSTGKLDTTRIDSLVDGSPSAGSVPSALVFRTGSTGNSERMRITSSGNVGIGTSSPGEELHVVGQGYFTAGCYIGSNANTNTLIDDASNGAGSTTLYIGNASITTSSDARIKENVVDTEVDALATVQALRVVDFTWNDPSDTSWNNKNARGKWTGLIAQEAIQQVPWAVNAPRDPDTMEPLPGAKDEEGNNQLWFMEYGQVVPVLIKAIQEQQAQIEVLKAEVAALKGE